MTTNNNIPTEQEIKDAIEILKRLNTVKSIKRWFTFPETECIKNTIKILENSLNYSWVEFDF